MPKTSLLRNVFLLVGGTTLAQLISILASPILTRLYTPEEYGVFALFTSVCAVFAIISSLTLEQAISLPRSNRTASSLYKLANIILIFIVSVVSLFVLAVYFEDCFSVKDKLKETMFFIPVVVFSTGLFMINNFWAIRHNKYGSISQAKIIQTLVQVSSQIFFSFGSGMGLIHGYVLGVLFSSSFLIVANKRLNNVVRVTWIKILASLKRYRRFPIFSTWEVLFNAVSLHSAPVIFALFMGSASAGLFALSFRIMSLPVSVIGTAVAHGLYGKALELKDKSFASSLLEKTVLNLFKLALFFFAPFFLFGPEIFSFVFGANWEQSGVVAQWITIWVVFQLVSSPLSAIFPIYEQQVQGLCWQVILVFSRLAALYFGFIAQDFMLAIALYCIVSALAYVLLLIWVSLLVDMSISGVFYKLTLIIYRIAVGYTPLFFLKTYNEPSVTLVVFMVLLSIFLLVVLYQKDAKLLVNKFRRN